MYQCFSCHKPKKGSDILEIFGRRICCISCISEYGVRCYECSAWYLETDNDINFRNIPTHASTPQWFCGTCNSRATRQRSSIPHRSYSSAVIGTGYGNKIPSQRGWSCEIECFITNPKEAILQFSKLPPSFGIGRDGSLDSDVGKDLPDGRVLAQGIEITTPILKGIKGEKYLFDLCKALNARNNAEVTAQCGLHLHIDMSDCMRDLGTLQRLLVMHWLYESVLMSFLPSTRRANQYCQSMKNDYHYNKLTKTTSLQELAGLWYKNRGHLNRYNKKHPRYHGVNFHCVWNEGHVEIRYHSGTTNPTKILHWACLHTKIIDYCAGLYGHIPDIESMIKAATTMTGRSASIAKLTKQLFEMLALPKETEDYFLSRQKKFKSAPHTAEVDFIEKDGSEIATTVLPSGNESTPPEERITPIRFEFQPMPQEELSARVIPGAITTSLSPNSFALEYAFEWARPNVARRNTTIPGRTAQFIPDNTGEITLQEVESSSDELI